MSGIRYKNWEILKKLGDPKRKIIPSAIVDALLFVRGIKTKKDKDNFFKPTSPYDISLTDLGIEKSEVEKSIKRLSKAKKSGESIIVYGDYDADGICGTAILWESLYSLGFKVLPYIPERFSEGYGINFESIKALKKKDERLKLVITVDNGIVAGEEIAKIKSLGIDVIVTDHHQKNKKVPESFSTVYSDKIAGSAISWIFSRELIRYFDKKCSVLEDLLSLAAIGTIADQLPLKGFNKSFAKYGLEVINKTNRVGILELLREAGVEKGNIGTYEINYVIAPRINAMGRIKHGIDSLRLLCTKSAEKARLLAKKLSEVNKERQRIVDEVITHVRSGLGGRVEQKIIIIDNESYHEGVIGLAAGKLVEQFYKPAIVISRGEVISKASARSISGFNIIETIRTLEGVIEEGGGHPMAAGFTILTKKIEEFRKKMTALSEKLLTDEILMKSLKIDLEVGFDNLTYEMFRLIGGFEPFGMENPQPTFITEGVEVIDVRLVGRDQNHLKLKLKSKNKVFNAVGFGLGEAYKLLSAPRSKIDIVYSLEENHWNGDVNLELKIKDLRLV